MDMNELKGSITKFRDKFRAYIDVPAEDGRKRKTKVGEDREELKRWLVKMNYKLNEEVYFEPSEMELSGYLDTWLERKREGVRESTADKYRWAVDKIKEHLGEIPMDKITPFHIQETYRKLHDDLKQNSIVIVANVIEMAMKKATKEKLLKENPCEHTEKPTRERKEMNYLNKEEVQRFLAEVEGEWPHECLYTLAIATGMRRSELMGLRWSDIDLDEGKIKVVRQLRMGEGWTFEFGELKTDSSIREIAINEDTIKVLKKHRQEQLQRKLRAKEWEYDNLVLTDKDGIHLKPSFWKKHIRRTLDRADCKRVTLHELRHTCATILLSEGVQPKIVQEILGHASISTTLDTYAHVIPKQQQESAEKMGSVISKS